MMLGEALVAKGDPASGIRELEIARDSLPDEIRIRWDLFRAYTRHTTPARRPEKKGRLKGSANKMRRIESDIGLAVPTRAFQSPSWRCPVVSHRIALHATRGTRRETGPVTLHFTPHPISFSLDSCETPERHVPETMAGGVAVFDYNNDGNLDIFFTNGADIASLKKTSPKYWNRLFRNNGDGTFTDVTEKAGLAGTGYDTAVAIGDYDNDGYEDIFVGGVYRNTLYHNNGDGTFTDVTEKAGLAKLDKQYGPLWSTGAAWVDVNNDGLLDLFVVNYLSWDRSNEPVCKVNGTPDYCHPKFFKGLPNQLFLNNGDGTFTDISEQSGIRAHIGKGMGVAVADFDGDGLPDFFVTNDKLFSSLFPQQRQSPFR